MALNAVGALQMTKTNNSNDDITWLRISTGRSLGGKPAAYSLSVLEDLNYGLLLKNPANGQAGT